ncbi:MAG: DNA-directed RNA polymerase subunit omega [Armatimonadota bacterium]
MLPSPDILNEYPLGKFVLSNLAAKRAKQLREGALPLVQIESRHPLTIALAEIAAGKIEPRSFAAVAEPVGEHVESIVLAEDFVAGEFGMLLPALDENEAVLIETVGLEDADPASLADDEEISLADLAVEGEEEEEAAPAAEDDTLSLSDIAEEEASMEDDAETE